MMNTELRSKLYDMFLTYNYEDSKELLKSVFTTLVIMEELKEDDIQKVLKKLYVDADVCFLDITYSDFYNYMTDLLIQLD